MIAAALAMCAVGVAACGGSSKSSGSGSSGGGVYSQGSGTKGTPTPAAAATVSIKVSKTKLGRILTDGSGRTLYLFEKDKGGKPSCFGACAQGWPPLMAKGSPKLAGGLAMSKLGSSSRGGGARQVTYGDHPLYYFAGDKKPGQTAGEGLKAFGAEWYALSASGTKVEEEGS